MEPVFTQSSPAVDIPYSDAVFNEQVRLLYAGNRTVLTGSIGISLATVGVLWPQVPHAHLFAWACLSLLIAGLRALLARRFRATRLDATNAWRWADAFVIGALLNGIAWSCVPIVFFLPAEPLYVLFICCLYAGYVSGSVASTAVYFPAFLAFSAPVTLAFAGRAFFEQHPMYSAIGIMVLFYAAASYVFARNHNRTIAQAIRLRFENIELLEDLRHQRDAAEQAVAAKDKFLAAASHDLRQPLHAIGLFADSLESAITQPGPRALVTKIRESTDALAAQFHGILDLSSLDANAVEHRPRHVDLAPVLQRLIAEFERSAREKNLELALHCATSVIAFVDVTLFDRIVRNLVENALRYTARGGITVTVDHGTNATLRVDISDTGCGIPRAEQEAIFTEYHQLANPERDRRKGFGLGLAIVRRLCRLTDIALTLQSEPNRGSTFSLTLSAGDRSLLKAEPDRVQVGAPRDVRIVVVDDDPAILHGTRDLLTRWGCDCIAISDPDAAMAAMNARDFTPELIIVDYRLGQGVNGLDVIEAIRQEYNEDLPALLITGETSTANLAAAKASGFPILHKPVKPGELRTALHVLTNHARDAS